MNKVIVLIGLSKSVDLGKEGDEDYNRKLWAIHDKIFTFGPAWHGNQSSIILESPIDIRDMCDEISSLISHGDLIVFIELTSHSVLAVGWIADEEGFDAMYPNAMKFGASPSGGIYPIS